MSGFTRLFKTDSGKVTLIANRLVITVKNSSHIIYFVREKQPIEPMRSLVTCLQGKFWVLKK